MNSFTQKISSLAGSLVPQSLGRSGYLAFVQHVEKKAQKKWGPDAKLWPRNSLLTKAFQPLVTHLDLSLFVPAQVSEKEWSEFRTSLKKMKFYFPWLGDLNVYDLSSRTFLDCANFFELGRDPSLKDPLLIAKRKPIKAEALVFLMKMIQDDWENLVSRPLMRIAKWEVHWRAISENFEGFKDFEMKEVFNRILHFAAISGDERKKLVQFLNKIPSEEISSAVWQFYPNHLADKWQSAPSLKGLDAECLASAVSWQIWQLWSQRGEFETSAARTQVENLLNVAKKALNEFEPALFNKTLKQAELFLASVGK